MNEKIRSIFHYKRGKVSSSKQQLLSKFSSDHAPIQYGVDYSSKVSSENVNKKVDYTSKQSEIKNLRTSPKKIFFDNGEYKEGNPQNANQTQKKPLTYETVSSISFQTSPPVRRKVILISSGQRLENISRKTNDEILKQTCFDIEQPQNVHSDIILNTEGSTDEIKPPTLFEGHHVTPSSKTELSEDIKSPSISDPQRDNTLNKIKPTEEIKSPTLFEGHQDITLLKRERKQPLSHLRDPGIQSFNQTTISSVEKKDNIECSKAQTLPGHKRPMKSDFVDPSLVSVAQRAKYIMVKKPNKSAPTNIPQNPVNMKAEDEENEEPVLSIKDRIKIFKENLNQTSTSSRSEMARKSNNRFKTQPLSFDDIARANAMILDQTEGLSTIASPSITNSNETLVDISEDSNSSESNTFIQSKTVTRVQSCLLNQKSTFHKSIDDEELIPPFNVKTFVKNCDKEKEVAASPKPCKNPAVSRRLAFKTKTFTEDRGSASNKIYANRPHLTQPITKSDIETSIMHKKDSNQSISDRISSIQQNENRWKTRITKSPDELRNARPGSLYEIQEQLQTNQANWRTRVEQKDVDQFTTEAKLQSLQKDIIPTRHSFHGSAFNDDGITTGVVVRLVKSDKPDEYPPKVTLQSNFAPNDDTTMTNSENLAAITSRSETKTTSFVSDVTQQPHSHKVTVPQMSGLSNFFETSEINAVDNPLVGNEHTSDDFNDIFLQTDLSLNIPKRVHKPTRKVKATSKNPVKNLNARSDLVDEYDETSSGIAESELKRYQVENIQLKAGFAEEALAGLTSKEDFSKVKLKRTESVKMFENFVSPYKDIMLISVKGRKKVQVRLVEPLASSINCGDCYLLVTNSRVFVWQGVCANVIETNKVNELGSWIAKCKDLNYNGKVEKPTVIKSNDPPTNTNVKQFWETLKCDSVQYCNCPGATDEDEIYEQRIQTTNMVYQVVDNQLVPMDEYWGRSLKHQMLTDNQVFIFDFGTELYLWSGNKAEMGTRMHGRALLRQLWKMGFDYECCSINPLDPLPDSSENAKPKKGISRPDWVIVGRLPQRGETMLFKEKFSDWPESSRLIKVDRMIQSCLENKSSVSDFKPVDLEELLKNNHPSVHLTIDGKSVGRGGTWKVKEDGILREFDVSTKKVMVWHITDNEAVEVERNSFGQFCSSDAYIIRWDFELKTLGRFRKNVSNGNLSSAFFFWQGSRTTVTEKTASALHTIDLDKDKVTQIRVKQHEECPAFCRLFDGSMIVHQGKRNTLQENMLGIRLFIIRGEIKGESHFVEVKCVPESLRSRSTFLLLNIKTGNGYLWLGRLSSEHSRDCAMYCVESLNKMKPKELGVNCKLNIKIQEVREGDEGRPFWHDLGAIKRWRSAHLASTLEPIRGWLVSSVSNSFDLLELKYFLHPDQDDNLIPSFSLLQSYLYKAAQPALFIIWTPSRLFLWQGWWPNLTQSTSSDSDEEDIDHDWSIPKNRIAADKLAALKSISAYTDKNGVPSSIVYAGLEPLAFQELFPFWEVNETAQSANIKKGYRQFQEDDTSQTLIQYISQKFSVSQLRQRPLPESVVLSKIESYLCDEEFENLFKITKEEFYEMTPWRQKERKKEVHLF